MHRIAARAYASNLSENGVETLGFHIVNNLFGAPAQKRLAGILDELYGEDSLPRSLGREVALLTEEARQAGCTELAMFLSNLHRSIEHDDPRSATVQDIRALDATVSVVRTWVRWQEYSVKQGQKEALDNFLNAQGIKNGKGVKLAARVTKLFQQRIPMLKKSRLSPLVYQWRLRISYPFW